MMPPGMRGPRPGFQGRTIFIYFPAVKTSEFVNHEMIPVHQDTTMQHIIITEIVSETMINILYTKQPTHPALDNDLIEFPLNYDGASDNTRPIHSKQPPPRVLC